MTTEFDLIRRYRGAFSKDDCSKFIDFIESFDKQNILIHEKENLHQVNHKTANVSFTYDFPAYSIISDEVLPKLKPCVDEYLEAVSILKDFKFLIYDLKVKKIPICGGFHSWHFENGSIPYSQRKFVFKNLCVVKYYTVITSIEQMQMFQLSNPFQDVNKVKNYCSVI